MTKIIARLFGGLGNQLFIYATARAMAERTGATLVLDTRTGFRTDDYERQFALQHFDTHYQEATALESFDFPTGRGWRYLFRKSNQFLPLQGQFYLTDLLANEWFFMPDVTRHKPIGWTWLEGYWQSPQYFEAVRPALRQELQVRSPLCAETLRLAEQIQHSNSVCVHLRMLRNYIKGVEVSKANELDIQHYRQGMDLIAQSVDNPYFFCFSDNPDVMEQLLTMPYRITFVTHNRGDAGAHEDFHLMTLCRHFVLSNSTFGWWAAWLGEREGSVVLSPPLHYWDNRDILPQNWKTTAPDGV